MTKISLAVVLLLTAAPALAQDELWPVDDSGRSCSMTQTFSDSEFGRRSLQISYDAAQQEIVLTSTSPADVALPDGNEVYLVIALLDNGRTEFDDGWRARKFTFAREGDAYHLRTAFAGEKNVRQILADLAASRAIGFMNQGKVMTAFELRDADASLAQLRACAARVVASN